ncbi:MAG: apiosidase-like domain-containing protein [Planctomycetota bacterium]|jgi:hypothetical protein
MAAIGVSANGRYFVDAEGRPFFWLGDTQWELFRGFSPPEARAVLERRKAQGFSVIQVMITGVGDGTKPDVSGETPWVADDPASANDAYFRNVDSIVQIAGELGLIIVPGVYHQLQRDRITTANARQYARWLARRYRGAEHVVWTMYPEAKPEYLPVLRELAAGLEEGDGGGHLITVHPDPSPTSSGFIHDEPWLAFNMIQTCVRYELIYPMVAEDYARTPVKPVVMAEGGYEGFQFGKTQTALEIRKQAWWSYLAGGHHSYGHNDHYSSPSEWRSWIDAPGALNLGVLREVLTALPEWWNTTPDQSILADGEGEGLTRNAAARHDGGRWVLVYLAAAGPVTINTAGVESGGRGISSHPLHGVTPCSSLNRASEPLAGTENNGRCPSSF